MKRTGKRINGSMLVSGEEGSCLPITTATELADELILNVRIWFGSRDRHHFLER